MQTNKMPLVLGLWYVGFLFFSTLSRAKELDSKAIAKVLVKQDYKIVSINSRVPSKWEKEKYQTLKSTLIKIKSNKPLSPKEKTTFFRFDVQLESFANPELAKKRLESLKETPPGISASDNKAFPLREGFQDGNLVVTVATDVNLFSQQLSQLIQTLKQRMNSAPAAALSSEAIVQAIIDHEAFQKYLHPEVEGRKPLVISDHLIGKNINVTKFDQKVKIVSDKDTKGAFIKFTVFNCNPNNYCNIAFEYSIEGISGGTAAYLDTDGRIKLEKTTISER